MENGNTIYNYYIGFFFHLWFSLQMQLDARARASDLFFSSSPLFVVVIVV